MKNLLPLELHTMSLNEGVMSEIHIMAKEARNVKEFIKEFLSEYGDKVKDSPETRKWLESMYNDTVNESIDEECVSGFRIAGEDMEIKFQDPQSSTIPSISYMSTILVILLSLAIFGKRID